MARKKETGASRAVNITHDEGGFLVQILALMTAWAAAVA